MLKFRMCCPSRGPKEQFLSPLPGSGLQEFSCGVPRTSVSTRFSLCLCAFTPTALPCLPLPAACIQSIPSHLPAGPAVLRPWQRLLCSQQVLTPNPLLVPKFQAPRIRESSGSKRPGRDLLPRFCHAQPDGEQTGTERPGAGMEEREAQGHTREALGVPGTRPPLPSPRFSLYLGRPSEGV